MADSVYYHLERMLPELDDLKQRGLFSKAEIAEIARRRREFEFRLERRSKLKHDYLLYIEYETQLESLRKLRKKALIRQMNEQQQQQQQKKKAWQKSLSDRTSAMRIMLIYQRAVTRFKGDLDLWFRYIEYCRSQGTRRMQKVLTKALQLHSTVPGLWVYAAAWEFEHNLNVTAARALMQRGLRICPHSENLWLQYLQMELTCIQRLSMNKAEKVVHRVEKEETESDGNFISTGETFERGKELDENLCYKLASTIYKNAVSAIPSSCLFRQRFIELLEKFDFEQADILQDEIMNSLVADFPRDESCLDWVARRHTRCTGKVSGVTDAVARQRAIQLYEDALNMSPSTHMFELYAKFLEDFVNSESTKSRAESSPSDAPANADPGILSILLSLYEKAEEKGVISPRLAEGRILLLLRLGKLDVARKLAEKLCSADYKYSGIFWVIRICLEAGELSGSEDSRDRIIDIFQQLPKDISITEVKNIWKMGLENLGEDVGFCEKLLDMLILSLGSCNGVTGDGVACCIIDWFLCNQTIEQARQAYRRLLSLPRPSSELYKHCIRIELRMVALGDMEAFQCVRALFRSLLEIYSQDAGLWLEYCLQEIKAGNAEAAATVYWRARKTLNDPSEFIEKYHQLLH